MRKSTVIQRAARWATERSKDPSMAAAARKTPKGKECGRVSCEAKYSADRCKNTAMKMNNDKSQARPTCEVGSVDTEGLVEIDGDSEGRLVLKEETKLEQVGIG